MTPEGFIALQVHSIRDASMEGQQIKWKNIRIKTENLEPSPDEDIYVVNLIPNNLSEAEKAQGFELLFDGTSADNFRSVRSEEFPSRGWEVKDGVLLFMQVEVILKRREEILLQEENLALLS
jgi:hypothetical protein